MYSSIFFLFRASRFALSFKKKNRAAFDLINTEQHDPMPQIIRDHCHTTSAEMDHITDPNTRTKKFVGFPWKEDPKSLLLPPFQIISHFKNFGESNHLKV